MGRQGWDGNLSVEAVRDTLFLSGRSGGCSPAQAGGVVALGLSLQPSLSGVCLLQPLLALSLHPSAAPAAPSFLVWSAPPASSARSDSGLGRAGLTRLLLQHISFTS